MQTLLSENEEKEFRETLHSLIKSFNNEHSAFHQQIRQPGAMIPLNLILKDETEQIVGGLSASIYWGWLDIEYLYLPQQARGKGLGSALLRTAEEIAVQKGCSKSYLSTFEFQAKVFYEKQGYQVIGTLEDYPPGSAFYWLKKDLGFSPPAATG